MIKMKESNSIYKGYNMSNKVIFKIIDHEAKQLLQKVLLIAEDKNYAAKLLNEIWDESLRQLWRKE